MSKKLTVSSIYSQVSVRNPTPWSQNHLYNKQPSLPYNKMFKQDRILNFSLEITKLIPK